MEPELLRYFQKIHKLEGSGASISFVKDDYGEDAVELLGPTQPSVKVMLITLHHWDSYLQWKQQVDGNR